MLMRGRNDHNEHNCDKLPVSGFNSSDILVDPYTYDYWNVSDHSYTHFAPFKPGLSGHPGAMC
jgi:hypothetical protein